MGYCTTQTVLNQLYLGVFWKAFLYIVQILIKCGMVAIFQQGQKGCHLPRKSFFFLSRLNIIYNLINKGNVIALTFIFP